MLIRILKKIRRKIINEYIKLRNKTLLFIRFKIFKKKPINIKFKDTKIFILKKTSIAKEIIHKERSLLGEISFVLRNLKDGDVFFDIGANAGVFSLFVSKKYKNSKVYAFEPTKKTFNILLNNIRLNSVKNVYPFNLALSDFDGETEIYLNDDYNEGLNSLRYPLRSDANVIGIEKVKVNKLDTFVKENNIKKIDFIKADIEGCELNMFKGAIEVLTSDNPPLLYFESYSFNTISFNYHPVELLWFLKDLGYKIYALKDGKIINVNSFTGYDNMYVGIK